jgi:hypothetical protein
MPGQNGDGVRELSPDRFLAFLAGDRTLKELLAAGGCIRAETPFAYPGRQGPVFVYLGPRPPAQHSSAAEQPPGGVRISDGGLLVKALSSQGMEIDVDSMISKTVYHAVRDIQGANLKGSDLYLDSTVQTVETDVCAFLQLVLELVGLRHGKYKDALIQLEKRKDADAGLLGWRPK